MHNTAILPPHPAHVMTPLLSSGGVTFASKNEELGISNETATILDNIRFLILATTRTVNRPTTTKEREKLKSTARWTRDGIAALPTRNELDSPLTQDFVYQSVIITAQIYCRAITEHIPLSKACRIQDLAQLWGSVWRVSLRRWKQIPGIFLWILLSAIQVAEKTPHGRFLKTMVKGVMTYLAVEFWDVVDGAGMGFVRLQRWLRGADIWDCREMEATEQHKEEAMDFLHVYEE